MYNKNKSIKSKSIISILLTIAMTCMLSFSVFAAGDGTGGGSGPSDLTCYGAQLCTISAQTATPSGTYLTSSSTVQNGSHIELFFNHNVASDYSKTNNLPVLSHNQQCIFLYDLTTDPNCTNNLLGSSSASSIYRLGDGTPTDPEKQHLFFDATNLTSGDNYEIYVGSGVICYNEGNLDTTHVYYFKAQ